MTAQERRALAAMHAALTRSRRVVAEMREMIVTSNCFLDADLRPRLETLDPDARPEVDRLNRLLRAIDKACAGGRPRSRRARR